MTQTADYAYDVFDRRIAKSVDDQSTVQTEYYVLDGQHVALRLDEEGLTQNRYLYGPAVDQILADERVTSQTSAGEVVWALTDHLGTVRDVVKRNGGTTTVLNHIQYDAFGNVVGESNSAQDFQFGYTGRDRDEESGLNYLSRAVLRPGHRPVRQRRPDRVLGGR